ncbi:MULTISPECIES: EscU/YscU/HrcU family type III secretion system export apparatus switch protein [Ramlibacter]|uniref:Flagellar type III secretion system protein FlhB n=1 Tax=Ramlibacter pinisoli TaxID=2682844 RepID=A0A6N8IS68_9BURK|nr:MULTISPECIES: EscU/YscU/HrcU family type III secretion system export apparatus switch protein [Ramlibacter]MBA2964794.1 EscU/YscU/HrcU family type III secretion system export apparatus switch protein [Ramlibacter sp. CGMCC 1.13660]MVQ29759.1 flagellar type III secretion system protein FlhB [Ramlibacter pinisoli]
MAEQDLDRNEAATPFKLQKARDQGKAPRSPDVVAVAGFAAAMAVASWHGAAMVASFLDLVRGALAAAAVPAIDAAWVSAQVGALGWEVLSILGPLLLTVMGAAILASLAQTGVLLSFDPLKPDLSRIHPATGLRRLFSGRTSFDAARAVLKLVVLVVAAGLALQALLPRSPALADLPPPAMVLAFIDETTALGFRMAVVLAVIAAIDLLWTRREYGARMRMSRRELKDEHRQREGDPRVRARLRELRVQLLKRSKALRNTRSADVVLTNPTHVAVALRYVHGQMDAPQVVAKGAGQLAAAMREIARRHAVVVVPSPALARRLFGAVDIDQVLPPAFHAEVARIIVWVFAMRQRRAQGQGAAG